MPNTSGKTIRVTIDGHTITAAKDSSTQWPHENIAIIYTAAEAANLIRPESVGTRP